MSMMSASLCAANSAPVSACDNNNVAKGDNNNKDNGAKDVNAKEANANINGNDVVQFKPKVD